MTKSEKTARHRQRQGLPDPTIHRRRDWIKAAFRSGLFRRVLPLILVVTLIPLLVLGVLNWISVNGLHVHLAGITINPRQVERDGVPAHVILRFDKDINGIKDLAVNNSYDALVEKSLTALELRAVDLSVRVASFLQEREQDARLLANMPPSAETYLAFSQAKRGTVWTRDGTFNLPLYKEIAFVDTTGQEIIRLVDEKPIAESALRDVSQPENTTYKSEAYFSETIELGPGEVYVQRLMGWYVPAGIAYANGENPTGQRYEGVMRFCLPVFQNGQKQGILVLSLDWTHAMELVAHVVGSDQEFNGQKGYVAEIPVADPAAATPRLLEIYSYLVGDDGWALYHPRNDAIVGLDPNGQHVPYYSGQDRAAQDKSGYKPVNAKYMQFLDSDYPHPWPIIDALNSQGELRSGNVPRYGSAKGVPKAMAWAKVPYYTPPYNTPAGFGWVGISIDAAKFTEVPDALGGAINQRATLWSTWLYSILGLLTLLAVAVISYVIYRMVSQPVGNMVVAAQRIAAGDLIPIDVETNRDDELVQLQASLAQMVEFLRSIITRIRGAALHMSSSAEEVKATLSEQAGVAHDSASAVAETTSTMEELAIIAAQIAERSGSVVNAAAQTQQDAQVGVQAVGDTVAKLDEIRAANESNVKEIMTLGRRTRRIGEVMELIDNIAARTKLIAFNAALEAAAAGESGRRFGVVAMEVRRLADNVVESTDEIRERVAEIQATANALVLASEQEARRIAEGVTRGQEANQALTQILDSSRSATMAAQQISLSTQQQRTAAEQVVDAVRSIQTGSQAVATGSQEATRVITDLVFLAEELRQAVEQFDLGGIARNE